MPELVLVIEDELAMRRLLSAALTSQGFRVSEASSLAHGAALVTERDPI